MPSPVGGLIELLSSTHGHGAMPIGLRIVRPLVICGAIVAVLQRPTMSQEPNYAWSPSRTHSPPSLRSPRTSKAVVRPRPRAGGETECAVIIQSEVSASQQGTICQGCCRLRRRCCKKKEKRKEGRKQRMSSLVTLYGREPESSVMLVERV